MKNIIRVFLCSFLIFFIRAQVDYSQTTISDDTVSFINTQADMDSQNIIDEQFSLHQEDILTCLKEIADEDYTKSSVQQCVGVNYSKINNAIHYIRQQINTRHIADIIKEMKEYCFTLNSDDYSTWSVMFQQKSDTKKLIQLRKSCDKILIDVRKLGMLGLNFSDTIIKNKNNYTKTDIGLPTQVFDNIVSQLSNHYAIIQTMQENLLAKEHLMLQAVNEEINSRDLQKEDTSGEVSVPVFTPLSKKYEIKVRSFVRHSKYEGVDINNVPRFIQVDGNSRLFGQNTNTNYTKQKDRLQEAADFLGDRTVTINLPDQIIL